MRGGKKKTDKRQVIKEAPHLLVTRGRIWSEYNEK